MNIYITPENETFLRSQTSMSGLINKLLNQHRDGAKLRVGINSFPTNLDSGIATAPKRILGYPKDEDSRALVGENIKINEDHTISPEDPKKPAKVQADPWKGPNFKSKGK